MRLLNRPFFSFVGAVFLFALAQSAQAQTVRNPPQPADAPATERNKEKDNEKDDGSYGSIENETRTKLLIREEKKRYDEHVERAREVFQLASQVCNSYESHKSFTGDDAKKLERMEKLTKRIRNEAGGSESDKDFDLKDIPDAMFDAVKQAAEWADDLKQLVEKTPRQVVSAAVINQANKLIGLVQRMRTIK